MTAATAPTLRIGRRSYPVILPRLRDPRLHLAAVIVTIHLLGQLFLGFRVSVPQILSAILTCAILEMGLTFRRSHQIVWPASAMLTGSGVALILRAAGTDQGEYWTWEAWYLFAAVAGFSLLSKYLIRHGGSHVFNPSNVGLVVAFLVLGSTVVEPLDFWWAPLGEGMLAAYLIILVGGVLITARLHLLAMAVTFWVVLAAGLGVLASSGHCMTAAWSVQPVCGARFWWIVTTSPEVLIFLFFMITDPKTIPVGRSARLLFAAAVAVVSTLLIAPQTTEYGAKVGLLAGLVLMSPIRGPMERLFERTVAAVTPVSMFRKGIVMGSGVVILAVAIVAAGAGAREAVGPSPVSAQVPEIQIDESGLPAVTIDEEVRALNTDIGGEAEGMAVTLAENLAIESEALRRSDPSLLRSVDHGPRLIALERQIEMDAVAKRRIVPMYVFDTLHLRAIAPDVSQASPSLGLDATGRVTHVAYDEEGIEQSRATSEFSTTFVISRAIGERWVIVDTRPGP